MLVELHVSTVAIHQIITDIFCPVAYDVVKISGYMRSIEGLSESVKHTRTVGVTYN